MRPILAVTLSALVLLAWSSLRPAGAGPAPRFAVGDVNGDGGLDISDPIFLLRHIFADGPPPVSAGTLELEERLARLEARELTDEQRELLGYFSLTDVYTSAETPTARTIVLTGVNLKILNGLPRFAGTNGAGNLILGHHELRLDYFVDETAVTDNRTGSHNIVIGDFHNYLGDGGVVTGDFNEIDYFGSVIGGFQNKASGPFSVIIGGGDNQTADGAAVVICGGVNNRATGHFSAIFGGSGAIVTENGQVAP